MSDRLTPTIEDLAKGIAAGSFRSEAEISQGVVKRVLNDLGWPVFDMQVVAPEFKIGTRKVDYALCQPPGKAAILVEVKDLGKADGKGQKQLFEYCFHQGVPIAVLTDGRTWSFFFPAGQGSYEERLFAHIDLLDDDHSAAAKTLARYLDVEDVKTQTARKRAERDYEAARFQKQAASKYASVWQRLLSGPEPLLLELFSEEVESATGVRPDPERAAVFIRGHAVGAGLSRKVPQVKSVSGKKPPDHRFLRRRQLGCPHSHSRDRLRHLTPLRSCLVPYSARSPRWIRVSVGAIPNATQVACANTWQRARRSYIRETRNCIVKYTRFLVDGCLPPISATRTRSGGSSKPAR